MRRAGALLAVVLLTLGVIVASDLALRLYFARREALDYRAAADAYAREPWARQYWNEYDALDTEWHPYVYWRHRQFAGQFINIDDAGLRKTSNAPECSESAGQVARIFVLGGSAIWGIGARDANTIPSRLAHALSERGHRAVCVVNLGEIGYVTTQEVVTLMLELERGRRPDIVIFFDGYNDAFSAFQAGHAGDPQNESHRREAFAVREKPSRALLSAGGQLVRRSGMYRLAERISAKIQSQQAPRQNRQADEQQLALEVVSRYSENTRVVEALAGAYGFKALFYWQPSVYSKQSLTSWEAQEARRYRSGGAFFLKVSAALATNRRLAALPNFHDLSRAFATDTRPAFIDYVHLSERANEVIASRMAADVHAILSGQKNVSSHPGQPRHSMNGRS